MTCEVHVTAKIQDTESIKRYLFPTDNNGGGEEWLQTSKLSISPAGDLIAIGNDRRLIVLTSKWDSEADISQFYVTFSKIVHEYDNIKAILCTPVVGIKDSTHVGPDWTCILIGYDSGYMRFYTENGDLLFEEQFHNENINCITCQSQHNPRPDVSSELYPEEIYIQYQSNVAVIGGYELFTNLRKCRSQLAIAQAQGNHSATSQDFQQLPLNIKKLGFLDQSIVNDVAVVGLNLCSNFDHLLVASNCGGFEAKYRSTSPHSSLVLAAGSKPFLGYHYALDGINQPVLGDVAKAVANKVKSALPTWLTGSNTQTEKEKSASMQPIESMGCRFGLCDLQRTAHDIILSPNRELSAITDLLGRVILVDSFRGTAIKIFKGYRDAQCAFIQVPDIRKSKHKLGNKVAHFMVVYAPKKGTLEIFSVQRGDKLATFSASRFSRLMYITYGLMGFTKTSKLKYVCPFSCIFMDNDGKMKEILIPFHLSLNERNNKRARDIHLYKKLKEIINASDFMDEKLNDEICSTCCEIKTIEVSYQTLEMILSRKQVGASLMTKCAEIFLTNVEGNGKNLEKLHSDEKERNLRFICQNVKKMLNLYLYLIKCDNKDDGNELESSALDLKVVELEKLQRLFDLTTNNNQKNFKISHVRFSGEALLTVSDFIQSFDLNKGGEIRVKKHLDESIKFQIAEVLFGPYITSEWKNYSVLQYQILQSTVSVADILDLLINYWINRALTININLEKEMNSFLLLTSTLVKCLDCEIVKIEYNSISPFWEKIREILENSPRPFPALMAAILFRTVAKQYELEKTEEENIEVLSQENVKWSLLIGRLEDVSTLNIIISNKALTNHSVLPKLKHKKVEISLKYILQGGKGSVSECVAQWLTLAGTDPEEIAINEIISHNGDISDNKSNHLQIPNGINSDKIDQVKSSETFKYLNILRRQFPYSLEASSLIGNMCWEYALAWRNDITMLENLEAAISCLNWVTNCRLNIGLHQLLWNTHLKMVVENACKLINKVGKLPKERLCQQDTGLTDKQITTFISICVVFLESFMDLAQGDIVGNEADLKYEDMWESGCNQSLVELACERKYLDCNLLDHQYQLLLILHMITKLSLKHSKPVNNLFETSISSLLFEDLQKRVDINWNKSDVRTNSSRFQFLYKDHVNWMQQCLILARKWNLEIDKLRRYQIVQLYMNGFDLMAGELISTVSDTNELGSELLIVAGRRLSQFLVNSPNLSQNITALSPILNKYLEQLKDNWCAPSSLSFLKILTTRILQCLDEDHKDYKIAELLLETCSTLENFYSEL
ncbi:rab3 GTPase-activating protein non-catalytic subunit isoform X2 [Cylas formicarius]|uniref:rab3 GTPase-activating protein non-catalytic subunit isoform X2 n=1 Tax=Cylas formicarius TaxID=197179 RepID=UPI00295832D6|nr:rab3 GTPase-activating protein non-catalytic subunit isoform X2 [Cylas formicarius]